MKRIRKVPPVIIEIRPSKLLSGQVGLFAARNLKMGHKIADASLLSEEYFILWGDFKKLDITTQRKIRDYCVQTKEGVYLMRDMNYLSLPWHMNHSCDGNVGFDRSGNFVTIKSVKKGSELLFDYGLCMTDPKYKMNCSCGTKKCRKVITGNDWKDPQFRKAKYAYMVDDMKSLIKEMGLEH